MNTLEQRLESLRAGVGDMQFGLPGDEGHCTAAEVIDAALAEVRRLRGGAERHRMTREEREIIEELREYWTGKHVADVLWRLLDRTKEGE